MHKLNIFDLYNEQHKDDVPPVPDPEVVKPADLPDNVVKPDDTKQPAEPAADPTPAPDPEPEKREGNNMEPEKGKVGDTIV